MRCETCGTVTFTGPDGSRYHVHNLSRKCWPGSSSDAVATVKTEDKPESWQCDDCGWPWPFAGSPPAGSECDNCGGELVPVPAKQ